MQDDQVERLDFSKPPPGHVIDAANGDHHDDQWDSLPPGDDESETIAAAWARYKARHDPPGAFVTGNDLLRRGAWFAEGSPCHAIGFGSIAAARAAAWAWYERRRNLAVDLITIRKIDVWPRCLAWSDADCDAVEHWLDVGGELPEVLCG